MTNFVRKQFLYGGGYLYYHDENGKRFVARFKRCRKDKPGFLSFLIRNFSVEEYFSQLEAGEPPARILASKGYVSKTVQEILTEAGYEPTQEAFKQYIEDQRG